MNKYKISAVSYLNTLPFIYGLRNHKIIDQIDLSLDNPKICAEKLINNQVDIGLIPVAVLPDIRNGKIISDFCIGAVGKVKSVILYSNSGINQVDTIFLDYQSRTSVMLLKFLVEDLWEINVKWVPASPGYEKIHLNKNEAGLVIGDRSFAISNNYSYVYDLSEQWYLHTGLPFVFATWTSNKHIESEFLIKFNEALQSGVNNLKNAVNENPDNAMINKTDLLKYLSNDISYTLDRQKKKGMDHFLKAIIGLK